MATNNCIIKALSGNDFHNGVAWICPNGSRRPSDFLSRATGRGKQVFDPTLGFDLHLNIRFTAIKFYTT